MDRLLRRIGLTGACGGILMFSDRLGAGAAAPETLDLDVFVGEADSWDVTSTLIYRKRGNPRRLPVSVMADLTVFGVSDTVALLGRTPAAIWVTFCKSVA